MVRSEFWSIPKACGRRLRSGLTVTAARVDRYIRRLEAGNFGAAKALPDGVFELRLDFGPGYRV